MKRLPLAAFLFLTLAASALAQSGANASARLDQLGTTIQTDLEGHGNRVLGHETYSWSTRLERFSGCRAEFSVRVTSNFGDNTVRVETVNFSLGALEPFSIELQKGWLQLPCASGEKCVFSTSTCSRKTKNGMVTDCATASQKRVDSFLLELDGDPATASRLERVFREAVNLCRQPKVVTF